MHQQVIKPNGTLAIIIELCIQISSDWSSRLKSSSCEFYFDWTFSLFYDLFKLKSFVIGAWLVVAGY